MRSNFSAFRSTFLPRKCRNVLYLHNLHWDSGIVVMCILCNHSWSFPGSIIWTVSQISGLLIISRSFLWMIMVSWSRLSNSLSLLGDGQEISRRWQIFSLCTCLRDDASVFISLALAWLVLLSPALGRSCRCHDNLDIRRSDVLPIVVSYNYWLSLTFPAGLTHFIAYAFFFI